MRSPTRICARRFNQFPPKWSGLIAYYRTHLGNKRTRAQKLMEAQPLVLSRDPCCAKLREAQRRIV